VVRLAVPPLRDRKEDVPYLVEHFIRRFNAKKDKRIQGITPAVMEILMRHDFPGNVRELENVIEYGFVLCHNGMMDVKHLPDGLADHVGRLTRQEERETVPPLERSEAETIRVALARHGGHRAETAEELRISRTTLWRKMKRYGIFSEG